MSIKDLFDNPGIKKIQKTVSSDDMVETVESKQYVKAKETEFDQFVPPIDFSHPSNFAKFGSAELYYEKAFERIHNYYPYDGTLAEKAEFHNSASYLDKYVFDSIYPRTNGYVNFDGSSQYITVFGGPHTASSGMVGNTIDSKFDDSMLYSESGRRTSALEYRSDHGATVEFWLKRASSVSSEETIFDIWNGESSGSHGYGRIKVELNTSDGIMVSMESGSIAFHNISLIPSAVDGNWNHYAITIESSSVGTTIRSFKNSQHVAASVQVGIGSILPQSSGINAAIGALYTGSAGSQKFSGSMDEFRYWKTSRTPEAIFDTWFIPVGGGTNQHDSNIDLGLYFKFNEGITGTTALDEVALDYSGRINNGTIVGYSSAFRSTNSAITEKLSEPEYKEPIIYSTHPDVVAKKAEYKTSGSLADLENSSMLLSYLPGWMQEEDEQNGKQLKYLCQVMGSYFDTLWHQISFLDKIHDDHYISGSNKPIPFAKQLLYDKGFVIPDLFVDATITENLLKKDDNEIYEKQISEVRNTIYHNLYNNLNGIYKSKGTEKSFRNFFRSLGIGQDVVKLRMYADDSTFVLRNNYEYKSYERKYLNFNYEGHFDATIYQTSSANNSNIYIPGDNAYRGSFTFESEIILPRKNRSNETGFLPFNGLTASVMGFHRYGNNYDHNSNQATATISFASKPHETRTLRLVDADGTSRVFEVDDDNDGVVGSNVALVPGGSSAAAIAAELASEINGEVALGITATNPTSTTVLLTMDGRGSTGNTTITSNFSNSTVPAAFTGGEDRDLAIYVIKEEIDTLLNPDDSHRVKFMVTGAFGQLVSPVYSYQYENNKWNLAVRLKHENYPYANVTGNVANNYIIEFYGVEADGNTKRNSFNLSTTIASNYFSDNKIFYAGAHRTNFTDTSLYDTDIKLGLVRYWHSYLSNAAIDQHAYDSETFGANEPFENDLVDTYPIEIPREKTLGFHWSFNNLTSSDNSGEMLVSDLSSGSTENRYGPLADTIERYVQGRAVGFNSNASNALDKNYIQIARKRLPDDLMSSDLTTIKSEGDEHFFIDDDVSNNFYSFEKSLYGTISDEMMNMFSTALDLNNLVGQPNQKYHHRYNLADFLRDRFYEDVENNPDVEKFTSFYKWIDDSISIALQQLTPASARFSKKINNIIESHVLERNKYVHQLPTLTTFQSTEGSIRGISEMKYDWKHGHAPFYPEEEQLNTLWQRERKERSGLPETIRASKTNHSIQSSGLARKEVAGSTRISDAYAIRKFAKTYDLSMVSKPSIHGGINFSRRKNVQLFHEAISPAGAKGSTSGVPQNIITVGVGQSDGILRGPRDGDNMPRKKNFDSLALVGKLEGSEYGHRIKGSEVLPMNLMSGSVHSGFNKEVKSNFSSDVVITNLHHDSVGNYNDVSLQGPFTEAHVGGFQYRHIDINKYDTEKSVSFSKINSGTFPSGSLKFTASVLSNALASGTGSSVTIRDGDGTQITAIYSNVYDLYDNQWTNMDELIFILNNKLDIATTKVNNNFLNLKQTETGSFYNYTIQASSHGFITASGFSGGSAITYSTVTRKLDGPKNRPEGWAMAFKDHPSQGDNDGSFGFIGADYGANYPNPLKLKATRYREETAKRPVNIRNIKTLAGSQKAGNYSNEIQIFSTAPVHQKTWLLEAHENPSIEILPTAISSALPQTTHYQTLMGITTYAQGNVFGAHANNRQPDGALRVPATPGAYASGSFMVSGALVNGVTASGGRFTVTGATFAGAFAQGSFEITSTMGAGTKGSGSFTMLETYKPPVSASYQFHAFRRTITGSVASGSFEVSGNFIQESPATGSFNIHSVVADLGQRSYVIFDANYQQAKDTEMFKLRRNHNAHGVEINTNGLISSFSNTEVSPITYQKAIKNETKAHEISGAHAGFSNPTKFAVSMWVRIPDNCVTGVKAKYLYQSTSGSREFINKADPHFEVFFESGSTQYERHRLRVRHWGTYHGYYSWRYVLPMTGNSLNNGDWTLLTFFRFGTTETETYRNTTKLTGEETIHSSSSPSFNPNATNSDWQYVMAGVKPNLTSDSAWDGTRPEISSVQIWDEPSAGEWTNYDNRQAFVNSYFNTKGTEIYASLTSLSSSACKHLYTFGDHANDPDTGGPLSDYGRTPGVDDFFRDSINNSNNTNLTSSQTGSYVNSIFAEMKTPSEYFSDLKDAIKTHNSASSYFDVRYVEYSGTVKSDLTSTWYSNEGTSAPDGSYTYRLASGSIHNFARFYITASAASNGANYGINPTRSVNSSVNQVSQSFFGIDNVSKTGSPGQGTPLSFENSTLTIAGNTFRFNNHNNDQSGNIIPTFSTVGKSIGGPESTHFAYFYNEDYPLSSPLNDGGNMVISYWHARATAGAGTADTILSLSGSTPTHAAGTLWVYSNGTNMYLKVYQNSTYYKTFSRSYADMGIQEEDLNHFAWSFNPSSMSATLYVNGVSNTPSTAGSAGSFSHVFKGIFVGGNKSNVGYKLQGRIDQLAIFSGISLDSSKARELYNKGRRQDIHQTSFAGNLTNYYNFGLETLPASGSTLASGGISTIKDRVLNQASVACPNPSNNSRADLTVTGSDKWEVSHGIPTDFVSDTTFFNSLSSSLTTHLTNYTPSYVDNGTNATFTITAKVTGVARNGDAIAEDSDLVYNADSATGGGVDKAGCDHGNFITIKSAGSSNIKFIATTSSLSSSTGTEKYIQMTGSNADFWGALSQSIKDHTEFDIISVSGTIDMPTRIFSITSSVREDYSNNAISTIGGIGFKSITQTQGGVDDQGVRDGEYIALRPQASTSTWRYFTVDVNDDGVNNTPAGYRYVHSATGSSDNRDWWDALSASIKAEGFDVDYAANSPSAGTASFVVTSYAAGAAGNYGTNYIGAGSSSFGLTGSSGFAGGSNAAGANHGDSITVAGTTFDLANTGVATATRILITGSYGSPVTDASMWEDLRSKIVTQTGYTVVTASSGSPRTFAVTSSVTGSSQNPNISESGTSFTVVNAGTAGTNEVGVEAGDQIHIDSKTFTMVAGAPAGAFHVSITGSSSEIRTRLSNAIKSGTVFDTVNIANLGSGYHLFSLTSSVVGTGSNGLFTTNSSGVRDTFRNLAGASGGLPPAGIVSTDRITMKGINFHLTSANPAPTDTSTDKYIRVDAPSSSAQIWNELQQRIISSTNYTVNTASSGVTSCVFSLTGSTTGSAFNSTLSETGTSFTSLANVTGGTNESGLEDGDYVEFSSKRFHLTGANLGWGSGANLYIRTTGSSAQIWSALKKRIQDNTNYNVVTSSSGTSYSVFNLTSSVTGASQNSSIVRNPTNARSFFNLNALAGGVTYVAPVYGPDNVIQIPRVDLTGSERNINTRFSAPGGTEIQTIGYLDAHTQTYSVHNALPWRNLSVRGSGSGEATTIKVNDHLDTRRGLRSLRRLHCGQFGIDSERGTITATEYATIPSFNKQHRNTSKKLVTTTFDKSLHVPLTNVTGAGAGVFTSHTAYTSSNLPSSGGMSFSWWANLEDEGQEDKRTFFSLTDGSGTGRFAFRAFYVQSSGTVFIEWQDPSGGNFRRYRYETADPFNSWNHYAISWNSANLAYSASFFVNNKPRPGSGAQGTATSSVPRQPRQLLIGDMNRTTVHPGINELGGRIQYFSLSRSNLDYAMVSSLYNGGVALTAALPSDTRMVDFWPLGNEIELEEKKLGSLIDPVEFASTAGQNTTLSSTSAKIAFIGQGINYVGTKLITKNAYDNMHYNTPIPRTELQYSWIHNATSGSNVPEQHIFGYAPRSGIVSSSVDGYVEAIVFPSASTIQGF